MGKYIKVTCGICGKEYETDISTFYKHRNKDGTIIPFRCQECTKQFLSQNKKKYWDSLPDNEKDKIRQKTSEQKKKEWGSLDPKEKENRSKFLKNIANKYWETASDEEKQSRSDKISNTEKKLWESKDEEKQILSQREKQKWDNLPDIEKAKFKEMRKKWWESLTEDQYNNICNHMSDACKYYWSSEENRELMSSIKKKWWENLPDEMKNKFRKSIKNVWNNLSAISKEEVVRKRLISSMGNNKLHQRFERAFIESHLVNSFYYIPEYPTTNNDISHCWDYGIFNENGELVALVDLDGAYFHADDCDYDGMHSQEEYDESRAQSVPDGIHHFIIQEYRFKDGFEQILKNIMLDYDQYVENTFRELRSQPFPYPHYTDVELMKSFDKLQRMDCNDKYHQDISLNTRQGDRLIQHFHQSIWHDHVDGELSPYEAWKNDDLLHDVIQNRIIYQTHLNPNKILQGFNIAKKAPKVSVFSAGRAKMIISRYLSEFDTVFDPFSGYSGRMLGAIASKKQYIGQDLSERHVRESNEIISFLHKYAISFDAKVCQQNILESNGEYPCLFTCPPYGKKEQWEDVPVDQRSCDDWIDECLQRFQCNRYVFVVDTTEKYKDNITAEISNKSHFSNAKEYIIIIDK